MKLSYWVPIPEIGRLCPLPMGNAPQYVDGQPGKTGISRAFRTGYVCFGHSCFAFHLILQEYKTTGFDSQRSLLLMTNFYERKQNEYRNSGRSWNRTAV